jgi:hypothetical protein
LSFIIGDQTPQLGAYVITSLFIIACIGNAYAIVFNKSIKDLLLYISIL